MRRCKTSLLNICGFASAKDHSGKGRLPEPSTAGWDSTCLSKLPPSKEPDVKGFQRVALSWDSSDKSDNINHLKDKMCLGGRGQVGVRHWGFPHATGVRVSASRTQGQSKERGLSLSRRSPNPLNHYVHVQTVSRTAAAQDDLFIAQTIIRPLHTQPSTSWNLKANVPEGS